MPNPFLALVFSAWCSCVRRFDRLADKLFPFEQGDADALGRQPHQTVLGRSAGHVVHVDLAASREVRELRVLVKDLRRELQAHKRDCLLMAGRAGTDIGNIGKRLVAIEAKLQEANRATAQTIDASGLLSEMDDLNQRVGEMEDRFGSRTSFLSNPSQN